MILVDVLLKVAARTLLPPEGVRLIPGLVVRVFDNSRGPFGIGPLSVALLASAVVLLLLLHAHAGGVLFPRRQVAVGLLVGGGLANLGERLLFGRTTDLLIIGDLTALNGADVAILAGILLLGTIHAPARVAHGG